ncbi:uncharacterized protein [Tenebrio molitor]
MAENTAELQVLQGNSAFTNNLYKVLAEKEGNVFFSPISVHVVLSMAYQGALDTTAEKFANTLHVPKAKAAAEGYNEIMKRLNSVTNVTLLMANKVFLMEGFQLLSDFENAVTKHFLSEVQLVDFKKNEEAAKTINSWVEVQTREKIKDLIQKDDLDGSTRLVLVNAIYFKGDWKHKFDKERTKTEPFYLNDKDTIDVQMMHIKKKFNYKNDSELQAQVIELPYTNEDLSMFIILPNEKNGIGNLEKKLATMNLTDISKNMWSTEVNLALPKFKIEQTIDLKDALTKLGLGEIFDERKANFGGMIQVGSGNLYVSKVVQKAFIEVNEEGAEAAAATVIFCVILAASLTASTMAENTAELQVLQGNNAFTNNLYKVLAEKEGNVFFSPISVHAVLSMAYQGALDTTAEKFANTLQIPKAKAAAEGYNEIMKRLNSVTNVTLLMANKVFLMEGFQLLSDFESAVTKYFLSEVQLVNFEKNEEAAKTINGWVEVQTREKIKNLIQKEALDSLTRIVLVNAIYFKGDWKHKFDKETTKKEPFYLNDKDTIDVQMMHINNEKFNYKKDSELQAQVIELPYINEDLSMFIILPNEKNGIGNLEKKLATMNLTDISKNMWSTEVNLALPKFKIEETIDLEDALTKLGLGEIFDESKANFRGMIQIGSNENLYVSKVIQKAFIEVNEEGAEAAASTGLHVRMTRSLSIPLEFYADHPFVHCLFLKNSKLTSNHKIGDILFYGKVNSPSSVANYEHNEL